MGAEQSSEGAGSKASGGAAPVLSEEQRLKYFSGPNTVQLAYSVLGGGPGFSAYHTSVAINGIEFFFDSSGVMSTGNFESHRAREGSEGDGVNTKNSESTQLDSGGGGGRILLSL